MITELTKRQIEEIAKLLLDLGKFVFATLVLGFFQSGLPSIIALGYGFIGLTLSVIFFTMSIILLREVG